MDKFNKILWEILRHALLLILISAASIPLMFLIKMVYKVFRYFFVT